MSGEPACGRPDGIPLRPLAAGEMLAAAVTAVRQNPAATLGLSAILLTGYGVVSTAISLALRGVLSNVRLSSGRTLTPAQARHVLFEVFAIVLPSYLAILAVALFAELILAGLLSAVIGCGRAGRTMGLGQAWRIGRPRLPAILGAVALTALSILGPWAVVAAGVAVLVLARITTAAVVVGALGGLAALGLTIWFSVMFSLATPAAALERQGPARALGRSWRLVRRSFWRVAGILLLTALVVGLSGLALRVPFGLLAAVAGGSGGIFGLTGARGVAGVVIGAAGSVVAGAVTRPVSAGVTVLLYLDLRMRQEGLDLARLATAARQEPCRQESR